MSTLCILSKSAIKNKSNRENLNVCQQSFKSVLTFMTNGFLKEYLEKIHDRLATIFRQAFLDYLDLIRISWNVNFWVERSDE